MRRILYIALALAGASAWAQNVPIHINQGATKLTVESGAELEIQSGATLDLQSGLTTDLGGKIDVTSGGELEISSGATFDFVSGGTWTVADGTIPRADLTQDDAAAYDLQPITWYDTGGAPLTSAEVAGTHYIDTDGSNPQPGIITEIANNETEVSASVCYFTLPQNYVDGETVTVRFYADLFGAGTNNVSTIDCQVYKSDLAGGIGSDLVTTAAQNLTTSYATYDFTVDPTSLAAGDVVIVQLTTTIIENASSNLQAIVAYPQILLDVKG